MILRVVLVLFFCRKADILCFADAPRDNPVMEEKPKISVALHWILVVLFITLPIGMTELGRAVVMRQFKYEEYPQGHSVNRTAPGPLEKDEYYFGQATPKEFNAIYVKGDSCDNLKAKSYSAANSAEAFVYGAALGPKEKAAREQWHNERGNYEAPYSCLPPVKNIKSYLEKGIQTHLGLYLNDGPILYVARTAVSYPPPVIPERTGLPDTAEWVLGGYKDISKAAPCADNPAESCVNMDLYLYNHTLKKYQVSTFNSEKGPFRILCWDCPKIKTATPKEILHSLKFHNSAYNAYMIDGGVMVQDNPYKVDATRKLLSLK